MAQGTVDDYLRYKKETMNKPAQGISPGSNPIFNANGQGIVEGTNVSPGAAASGDVDKNGNIVGQSTRVGDYVYSRGRSYLIPNSPTDLKMRGMYAVGGYKRPTSGGVAADDKTSWVSGATAGASAGATVGAFAGPVGSVIGSLVGGLGGLLVGNAFQSRSEEDAATKEWLNQKVEYGTAVDFYRDDDGTLKYKFDFSKMSKGGELSSPDVINLQNQGTKAWIDENGVLQLDVSPIFAQTDYFNSIVEDISKSYAGLTAGADDYDEIMKSIVNRIDSARDNYLANTISYAAYKVLYPDASPAAIIAGYTTSFAGNADPKDMGQYTVYTVNDGEIVETTAKDYFDSIYEMNKDQRNDYVKSIMELVANNDADQDERAVAYGDLQALYAVSANKYGYKDPDDENKQSKYQGMLNADWIVTFWAQWNLLDNVFLQNGRQEYLVQDEGAKTIGAFSSAGVNTAASIGGMYAIGRIMRATSWGSKLYNASMMGSTGEATAFFAASTHTVKELVRVGAAGFAFNTIRSTAFNAARSGVRLATGDKFEDVAADFGKDVAMDVVIGTLMEFYDTVKFKATVDDTTQFVYRDKNTGNIKILKTDVGPSFTDSTGAISPEYTRVGKVNTSKTKSGVDIAVAQDGEATIYRYGDQFFAVGKDGKNAQWVDVNMDANGNILDVAPSASTNSLPAPLKSGVVQEEAGTVDRTKVAKSEEAEVRAGLEAAGLPSDTEVFKMPSREARSAEAAGKFLKMDSSKVGLKINESVFNSNAALDYVNERALARTGNRTAWQNANEVFANTQQLANTIREEINSGTYKNPITGKFISAAGDSRKAYIKFREETFAAQFGKMTKADNLYMKAKESIARAELAQKDIDPKSGIDLVKEAMDKNGKYLNGIPADRAEALDQYVKLNKKYINDYIMAVKLSGLLDTATIDNVINSDLSKKLGYIPMWGKKETYNNLLNQYFLVDKEKRPIKSWNRSGEIVDVKDIMDFTVSTDYITDMFATNMAHSYTNMVLMEQLQDAGMLVDNRRTTASERRKLLMRVENYDELSKELKKRISDTKKYVNENVPSQGDYKKMMEKIYDGSEIETSIKFYKDIETEFKKTYDEEEEDWWDELDEEEEEDLDNDATEEYLDGTSENVWNEIQKLSSSYMERGVSSEDFNRLLELNDEIASNSSFTKQQMADYKQLTKPKIDYKTDPIKDMSAMSYEDRKRIAEDVVRNHQREDGLGSEYMLLYRVQGGAPDKWRPNNRGKKGKFEGHAGELKGAVWLTADSNWAEGPERATAGVDTKYHNKGEKVTDENIVVLPVKRSDILYLNHETGAEKALKESDKKIVKTRGIDNGLEKSEFILWKDDHPEIFEDGMKLMMDEYNKDLKERTQKELNSTRNLRKVDRLRGEINVTRKALNDMKKKRIALGNKIVTDMIISDASKSISEVAEYNKKFGRSVDAEAYVETTLAPALRESIKNNDMDKTRSIVANGMIDVAPYTSRASVMKSKLDSVASDWRKWAEENVKVSGKTSKTTAKRAVDVVAAEINGETVDGYEMGAAKKAASSGETYPITCYKNGRPYTRYMEAKNDKDRMIIEHIEDIITNKELMMKRGVVSGAAHAIANSFRLLTTAFDPSRATPNLTRDTMHSAVASGGVNYTAKQATKIFNSMIEASDLTEEQKKQMKAAFENSADKVGGSSYNSAYGTPRKAEKAMKHEYYGMKRADAPNKFVKFVYSMKELKYDLAHDRRHIFEAPGNFFEGLTRKRMAKSSFVNGWQEAIIDGKDFGNQLMAADAAATMAGNEFTANFSRKGKVVGKISQFTAYFSTNFANADSFKRAYINDPRGVSRNFAIFLIAYTFILADTLSNEKSRKTYYRLSDYDRANSIAVSVGDGMMMTIPMDETLAGLMFPFRRILETMNNVDPVSFWEFVWGTVTEPLPLDFSGFSEGDYFNFRRGVEKIMSQAAPTAATGLIETATGYDLYYGSNLRVTDEELRDRGIYNPQPGDYTTAGKNSSLLRGIANATGIPQWQLQSIMSNFGGNVGQYAVNIIDQLSSASEEDHGGKDFKDAIFKSFLATDSDNVKSEFYTVIRGLQEEKNKLLQKLVDLNKKMVTASGEDLYKYQQEAQKAREDYGTLVGDAVSKYLNAYEITGGLSKSQANQVYYLFRLDDNESVYQYGSVGDYYSKMAEDQSADEATSLGARVMDKYFNQSDRPYLDKDGTWRIAPSYSENAFYNTVYGSGMKFEVDLRNLLEGKENSLKDTRQRMYDARSIAASSGDWDLYNQITMAYDKAVIDRIAGYIFRNGAERVLTNTTALDYLEEWIKVPTDWMTNKKGKYVSLGHDASKERAYVRPYIKYLFGLDTGLSANYDEDRAKINVRGQNAK